jgi:predicted nuclease with TOPRIM domain
MDINEIERLKSYKEQLEADRKKLEAEKAKLESQLVSLHTRLELEAEAKLAEEIYQRKDFKQSFCGKPKKVFQAILEIAETVAEVLLATPGFIKIPATVAALIAIKIAKVSISVYCDEN